MPLWIDVIVFHTVVIWGWSIVMFSGPLPGCCPRVCEIDEVSGIDPLPLYVEFFRSHAIDRFSWLYGGVVV
jgi:hypothetical protein